MHNHNDHSHDLPNNGQPSLHELWMGVLGSWPVYQVRWVVPLDWAQFNDWWGEVGDYYALTLAGYDLDVSAVDYWHYFLVVGLEESSLMVFSLFFIVLALL